MQIKSVLDDHKVSAKSILIEITVREYLALAKQVIHANDFQRKRVRGSKSVYSLLKADILAGCVIPPLVLAYTMPEGDLEHNLREALTEHSNHFVILDGLQRTHTLIDIESETAATAAIQKRFLDGKIRCEIYQGINRLGILYRMLTLNTGQTAMSLRHQIEIMYLDFLGVKIDGVTLVREVDGGRARSLEEYNFREAIEGFNSYLERSESPLDRGDILDNISSLENLAKERDNHDIFREFFGSWHKFMSKINSLQLEIPEDEDDGGYKDDEDEREEKRKRMWATNGVQAFKRAQALSGFGAAIGLLKDDQEDIAFSKLPINEIQVGADGTDFLTEVNDSIADINARAKRIGNAQRLFFKQFFKMLFWRDSGAYLNMHKACKQAHKSAITIGV